MKPGDLVQYCRSINEDTEFGFVKAVIVNTGGKKFPGKPIDSVVYEVVWFRDGQSSWEDENSIASGQIRVICGKEI